MYGPILRGCWCCCWGIYPRFADGLRGTLLPPIYWTLDKDCASTKGGWEETKVPPCYCAKYGLKQTFCCKVRMPWLPLNCWPKGGVPPTLPNEGLFPNGCELDLEYARPTFCCPCGAVEFQFHPNGKPTELPGVGFMLVLLLGNGGDTPFLGRNMPSELGAN